MPPTLNPSPSLFSAIRKVSAHCCSLDSKSCLPLYRLKRQILASGLAEVMVSVIRAFLKEPPSTSTRAQSQSYEQTEEVVH